MTAPPRPTFAEALRFWWWLGWVSFGGPAGQIATMHRALVDERRWISEKRFLHALQYCMVLPGPEAQQLATYVGWLLHGTRGGIAAGALFVLPSLGLFMALSWLYLEYGATPWIAAGLGGVRAAVVAVVLGAAWRIGRRSLKNPALITIAALSLAAMILDAPFPAIVVVAALVGIIGERTWPGTFHLGGGHAASGLSSPSVIDDDSPPPAWSVTSASSLTMRVGVALTLGAGVWLTLPSPILKEMARFFTQAALVTVGGAYAVLPYVAEGAAHHGWASPQQVMDGLALGEATPGPLIMIVAWVGFLGGWQTATELPLQAAVLGAIVATLYTFLPSFLFILAGAPFVEAGRSTPRLSAPLAAISAAVVGVIVHLAVVFGVHAFAPDGALDPVAVVLGLAALMAVFRFDVGVVKILAAAGLLGIAVHLLT